MSNWQFVSDVIKSGMNEGIKIFLRDQIEMRGNSGQAPWKPNVFGHGFIAGRKGKKMNVP